MPALAKDAEGVKLAAAAVGKLLSEEATRRDHERLLTAILAVVLGFATLTADQSLRAIIFGGYWVMLLMTALFAWSLWRVACDDWRGWDAWWQAPRWPAALIVACGILLLVHERYGFKILMDEVMLETKVGQIPLSGPIFRCPKCRRNFSPLKAFIGPRPRKSQYDARTQSELGRR